MVGGFVLLFVVAGIIAAFGGDSSDSSDSPSADGRATEAPEQETSSAPSPPASAPAPAPPPPPPTPPPAPAPSPPPASTEEEFGPSSDLGPEGREVYEIANAVCGAFPPRKVARDLGVRVSKPLDGLDLDNIAFKYAEELAPTEHRQAAYEGCLHAML